MIYVLRFEESLPPLVIHPIDERAMSIKTNFAKKLQNFNPYQTKLCMGLKNLKPSRVRAVVFIRSSLAFADWKMISA